MKNKERKYSTIKLSIKTEEYLNNFFSHTLEKEHVEQFYFHSDHLGSSNYITNYHGNITQHAEYLPFGELLVDEHRNSHNTRYKYNGKEFDQETGNYYYGARYYNPKTSLWLSVDPLAEKYNEWSPYNYTLNNPVKYVDPDGRSPDDIIYLDMDGNEIDRIEWEGDDIYMQETYGEGVKEGLNVGNYEKINITETYATFEGERSPGRDRVDGDLSLKQTFDNGLTRTLDSWPALSGSRNLLPVPNGDDWQLSDFHYRDGRVNKQHPKGDDRRIWQNDAMTKDEVGFSIAITPDRYGRSLMRVHPDGGLPGTRGCIGLKCGSERLTEFENMIRPILDVQGSIRLKVKGSYNGSDRGWSTPIDRTNN